MYILLTGYSAATTGGWDRGSKCGGLAYVQVFKCGAWHRRAVSVPKCNRQSASISKQPHSLLLLHHALSLLGVWPGGHTGADNKSVAGKANCEQAASMGTPDNVHRAHKESKVWLLETWLHQVCSWDWETLWIGGQIMWLSQAPWRGNCLRRVGLGKLSLAFSISYYEYVYASFIPFGIML